MSSNIWIPKHVNLIIYDPWVQTELEMNIDNDLKSCDQPSRNFLFSIYNLNDKFKKQIVVTTKETN